MGCFLLGNSIQTAWGIEFWNPQSFQKCAVTCMRVQIIIYVQWHLSTFKIAFMLLFLWVLACRYTCKYLCGTYFSPRTVLSSEDWQIRKFLGLILLRNKCDTIYLPDCARKCKARWQYLGHYTCLVLLWQQSHQHVSLQMFLLCLSPPFCINRQRLD